MEIKIKIEAPGLEGAIHTLAQVLANYEYPVKMREWEEKKEVDIEFPPKNETPVEEPAKEEVAATTTTQDAPSVSLETVRAKLAALSQAGKQKEVKGLITSFGVRKLTEIPKEHYPTLMEKAEAI